MRDDIKEDGKFTVAGESAILELHVNKELKGDEKMERKEGKIIDINERRELKKDNQNKEVKLGQIYYVTF